MKKTLKHLFLFFFLSGIIVSLFAREEDKPDIARISLPEYNFIDYKANKISLTGKDSSRIKNFYQKIDRLLKIGEGQINILHIGASHVQADMFSHEVRLNLEAVNARFQSPRGFVFPFSAAKTNNPTNYKVSYTGVWEAARNVQKNRELPLGMSGIAVCTSDPEASISIDLNPRTDIKRWNFSRLRLLGYAKDGSDKVKPVLSVNEQTFEPCPDEKTNTYLFELPELADTFQIRIVQEDSLLHPFVIHGFIPEKNTPGIVYHAIGVNGASVPSYLNCEFFEDELPLIQPDLVIFGIGINDASGADFTVEAFIENYNLLIQRIKRVSPDCAFIFITNNDSYKKLRRRRYAVNPNGITIREAFFELAKETGGGVWDLFSIMGGLKSMQIWQTQGLAQRDKIHFTKTGYELLGDMLYNALIDFYLQNNIE